MALERLGNLGPERAILRGFGRGALGIRSGDGGFRTQSTPRRAFISVANFSGPDIGGLVRGVVS